MDLSVILLSYNTRDITLKTLSSLGRAITADKPLKIEVIVVDNASTDGSQEALQKLLDSNVLRSTFYVLHNADNLGFSKGNNIGLKQATGKYVLFLNSDMLVDELRLSELITYMDAHPKVGVLTPRVELSSGQIDPASHRGFPTVWRSFCYYSGIERLLDRLEVTKKLELGTWNLGNYLGGYHLKGKDLTKEHNIDACTGAFLLIRGDLVRKVGGFDEQFFMYGEDLDLCYQVKALGYQVIWYPHQKVTHLKYSSGLGSSTPETRKQIRWHFYDAMEKFYLKHYSPTHNALINRMIISLIHIKKS
jgi:GT2 family glycosyltransferase